MANDEWRTPEWVWKPCGPFHLDAAADEHNTVAPKFITKEMDAFHTSWVSLCPPPARVWCNPPYSQAAGPLAAWVELFFEKKQEGFHIFALLPADTSTRWFHQLLRAEVYGELAINFLERRVRHLDPVTGKPGGSPKFGSIIVEFFPT